MSKSFKLQHGLHTSLDQKPISMIQANESPGVPFASASGLGSPQHSATSTDFGSLRMLSMSAYPPFTESEKIELLVNILQSHIPDLPSYLLQLVLEQQPPQWYDVALPKGRSIHACQIALQEMQKQQAAQLPQTRSGYQTTSYPAIAPAPPTLYGRSFSEHEPSFARREQDPNLVRRTLQPKPIRTTESPNPVTTNGESPTMLRAGVPLDAAAQQRKRGRPTNAEVEERKRQAELRGEVYLPKRRGNKRPRPSLMGDTPEAREEESETPLLQTPVATVPEPTQESSSGKRRRTRVREGSPSAAIGALSPTRVDEGEQESGQYAAESPSNRLLFSHRERGSVGSTLSRPTQQESEALEPGRSDSGSVT